MVKTYGLHQAHCLLVISNFRLYRLKFQFKSNAQAQAILKLTVQPMID